MLGANTFQHLLLQIAMLTHGDAPSRAFIAILFFLWALRAILQWVDVWGIFVYEAKNGVNVQSTRIHVYLYIAWRDAMRVLINTVGPFYKPTVLCTSAIGTKIRGSELGINSRCLMST